MLVRVRPSLTFTAYEILRPNFINNYNVGGRLSDEPTD